MTRAEKIDQIDNLLKELLESLEEEAWTRALEIAEALNQLGVPTTAGGPALPATSQELDFRDKLILAWRKANDWGNVAKMEGPFPELILSSGKIQGEARQAIAEAQDCLSRIR